VFGSPGSERVIASDTVRTEFWARPGNDIFSGSPGDDFFDGNEGSDRVLFMGDGQDSCQSVEVFDVPQGSQDCETVTP